LPIQLPDDPSTTEDMPAYSKKIDLGEYCEKTKEDVRKVIEGIYPLIIERIRRKYHLRSL
jgi:hypothetical protein